MKLTNLAVLTALCFSIALVGDAEAVTTSVTGTVVSSTSDRVVLNTPSGEMTFKFTPLIDRPSEMLAGSRVTVWYDPAETGVDDVAKASRIVSASSPSTVGERAGMTSAEERSGGGTSVTGTVVSSTSERLVLRTSTGEMTFKLSSTTDRPMSLREGSRMTVWYDPASVPGDENMHLATRITASSEEAQRTAASDDDPSRDPSDDELPATAGPLPLLAWIGIFAVGGGLALRGLARRRSH
jgi:RNase P/RNase MRP subunit p29